MKRFVPLVIILAWGFADNANAQTELPQSWKTPALEVVSFFEGATWNTVSPDFDCNGASVGTLQWNIGKGTLKLLLEDFSPATISNLMPKFGKELMNAVNTSHQSGLIYVRKFQTIKNPAICDNGNARGAKWKTTQDAKDFVRELSTLMGSEEGRRIQLKFANQTADTAWAFAKNWSLAKRGNTSATYTEFVFFYDTVNFNGILWGPSVRYSEVAELKLKGHQKAYDEAINYLETERSHPYLQTKAADKDAALWKHRKPTEDELDLFLHAYLLAKWITKKDAIQFRLNVISRRGVIIYKDGVINKWAIPGFILKDLETPQ